MTITEHNIEPCLSCGLSLTPFGQCPQCDAAKIKKGIVPAEPEKANKKTVPIEREYKLAHKTKAKISVTPAFLFNKETKERFELTQAINKVGRDSANNISIKGDHHISRYHAWVLYSKGKFWVEDLGSTNGTFINGKAIKIRVRLTAGDRVTFGKTELIFVVK